ncbi:integrase core domain-containing protein [Rhodococcus koreensis]|uniref:integrase core domain-containing protein n=1 Tax=Rhodococcus koreensis TaxID=99653 RepID=UPI00198190E2|nr:integrase core domain-containing protein [Rhodococcus koreensis]QSE84955.1 transposase [Rhodococcus koreensis]
MPDTKLWGSGHAPLRPAPDEADSTSDREYYYRHTFVTKAEFVAAIDKWMDTYNSRRRHSSIGMLSPDNYERSLTMPGSDQAA